MCMQPTRSNQNLTDDRFGGMKGVCKYPKESQHSKFHQEPFTFDHLDAQTELKQYHRENTHRTITGDRKNAAIIPALLTRMQALSTCLYIWEIDFSSNSL